MAAQPLCSTKEEFKEKEQNFMIDLHCHSTYSDGSFSPAQLLDMAEERGLEILSITDHDHIEAYTDLLDPAVRKRFSGKLITGVEIAVILDGQPVEVLGYGFDPKELEPFLEKARQRRSSKAHLELLYREYLARGVKLVRPMEEYSDEEFLNPRRFVFDQLLSEKENHAFFLDFEKHTTSPLAYYRNELYNKESPLYIDCQSLFFGVDKIVEVVHQAGGRAFLAHSYCYTAEVYDHLDDITDRYPLDGLECFYPAFTPKQTEEITALCARKHLLMSGGSDFHGAIRPNIALGVGAGELNVSKENTPWIQTTF